MARGNKNRLLVSGAALSVALLNGCTSGDEAPPSETSRPAVTSEQSQQGGRPNAIQEMAAAALNIRDNPPSGATRTTDESDPDRLLGDLVNGTTKDGKPWHVSIFPSEAKDVAEVQRVTAIVNPGTTSEKAILAEAGMFAVPLDALVTMQYSYSGSIEGIDRPIVSVSVAYAQSGKPVDNDGIRQYDTKSIRGTDEQISLEVCGITYRDSTFPQAMTLGRAVIESLQQGEDPVLTAPQAAFYGPPDQNALCAGA